MGWKQAGQTVAVSLLVVTSAVAQERTGVVLPKPRQQGREAIQAMGDRLPEVARAHALSAVGLTAILSADASAWLDDGGRLFYVEASLAKGPAPAEPAGDGGGVVALSELDTFRLHSHRSATKVVFLDFDGEYTVSPYWNGGDPVDAQPYDVDGVPGFSAEELSRIRGIWQRVAEDFAPFDVDVTTEEPNVADLARSGADDLHWGVRVVVTPTADWFGVAGGVAYYDSFNWASDTPCWVFSSMLGDGAESYTAEACSHEIGHTLNLTHDGLGDDVTYYGGHGSGAIGWAPIMGVGYAQPLVQWSNGEYPGANNAQDDLDVIVTRNGFGYRSDDHGDDADHATEIELSSVGAVGVIQTSSDVDVFVFAAGAGPATIDVKGDSRSADLDIRVDLRGDDGALVASSTPPDALSASLSVTLEEGIYTLHVTGVGNANCSDYASLGQFTVTGSVARLSDPAAPTAQAGASGTEGEAPIAITASPAAPSSQDAPALSAGGGGGGGGGCQLGRSTRPSGFSVLCVALLLLGILHLRRPTRASGFASGR